LVKFPQTHHISDETWDQQAFIQRLDRRVGVTYDWKNRIVAAGVDAHPGAVGLAFQQGWLHFSFTADQLSARGLGTVPRSRSPSRFPSRVNTSSGQSSPNSRSQASLCRSASGSDRSAILFHRTV